MTGRPASLPQPDPATPYRIRLQGPYWACWERVDRATGPVAKGPFRVRLPGDWRALFGNTAGRVRLWRRFGRPTHLQPGQSVQVVVPPAVGLLRVRVNERLERGTDTRGAVSGFAAPVRLEVSHLLRTNNLLELWLELDPDRTDAAGGLPAPIVLEIHGPPQTA